MLLTNIINGSGMRRDGGLKIGLLLVGLGVDELSMGYTSILEIREMLSKVKMTDLTKLVARVLKLKKNDSIRRSKKIFR